jgi:hypothetical protein
MKSILPKVSKGRSKRSKTPNNKKTTPNVVKPRPISKCMRGKVGGKGLKCGSEIMGINTAQVELNWKKKAR